MTETVIISGARTPFGKLGGALSSMKAAELGGIALKETMKRGNTAPEDIDHVLMGTVLQGGQGQLPSRQALHNAGIPWETETETINKVCASGMRSVTLADLLIRTGQYRTILAGGMESMSQAPYFMKGARFGFRMGDQTLQDMMVHDGLTCTFRGVHMGNYGNQVADELQLDRESQDEWALRSHQRAGQAVKDGRFAEEIAPVAVPQRKGEPLIVSEDEAPRSDTTLERLKSLKPVFGKEGTITAGNAPGVNDGACALLLMSKEDAVEKGHTPLAVIKGHTSLAVEPENFPKTPGLVIQKLLDQTGKTVDDIDLFEINEAFAAVSLAGSKIAGLDNGKVNVNGGAVALGHPIGASGTRIILTLAHELKKRGGGTGIAAICSGGGQGDAIMIEVE
ncbi:acetyl-CoA C-acetyltransferase [Salisediminibacterium selenitireducens]|uniref:acetyl-CoA C-acetyltransferase n=1 Tax=Bacillus selenitireducens (strain ATCC 700615 / DSM 15326 / MLS10) TaxID=439292 RepID=D6Y0V5_BACIE|nr:acetyl-CoA C-acetyltransferase [Salisediminibacterium selenitireducens]ADI00673.1 acetyl-CoA acetyltransferase [[Bacillus] selenitireducens MLS10]